MTTPAPSIPDFIAGFGPQASDMQGLWVNAAAFFQQRVVFRATQATTATTLPSTAVLTSIIYDNIIEDPYSGWNATGAHWVAPFSGWYQVTMTTWVTAPGALQVVLWNAVRTSNYSFGNPNYLTGTTLPNAAGGGEGTDYVFLGAGDSVAMQSAVDNSSSNVTTSLTAGQQSSCEIVWIS